MADKNGVTDTDIYQQQKKTIDLLNEVLLSKIYQTPQPVYVSQPQESSEPKQNYVLIIGLVIAGIFLFTRK